MAHEQQSPNLARLKDVLALAVRGEPFDTLLHSLMMAARNLVGDDILASVYLVGADKHSLELASSVGLGPDVAGALARIPIGEHEACCGRAAWLSEAVVVGNVFEEPRMAAWLSLARAEGIRACWSYPLHSAGRDVVGTLAFYHRRAQVPDAALDASIGYVADLAALLIERHQRERELQRMAAESERRRRLYEAVLGNTPDLVYVFGLDHRFIYANDVLLRMWGRSWDDAIGKNCLELGYPQWHAEMHGREIEQVKATRAPIRGEVPFHGAFGLRIYDYIFTPVLGPDGEVEAVAGTTRDVTERKRFEEQLRASEERFRTITNAMPQMVWTARPDGAIDYHNEQFYRFAGLAAGSIEGDTWAEAVLHPADRELGRAAWARSVNEGIPYETTYRIRHHSGEYRWILARALPLRDENGQVVQWLGTDTDIHQQKLAEDALQAANQRKDEFLAMLAHELRNPLAPISAAAQVLRLAPNDPSRVRSYADVISRQVGHMTTLVDDLLDVSRVTRGVVQFERVPVDLREVAASAAEQVQPLVAARRHALELALDPAPAAVLGDRARLVQVLANLLANAAKYTAPGGRIVLALAADSRAGTVTIRVLDNGSGIDAGLLPHVFELFTQGERTPDRAQGGLGLGLALVRTIVLAHGGQVDAESAGPGQGSTFTVTLPLAPPPPAAQAPLAASAPAAAARRPLRILLVDDNLDAASTLASLLEAAGHRVTAVHDPGAALATAAATRPQALILDIGLPGMDGHALARRLRADPALAGALFLALTGYGQPQDRLLSQEAGFDHHLVKPVDPARLLALLDGHLT